MHRYLSIILLLFPIFCHAQITEVGYVKQYNGKEAKSSISGVEIQVENAPSTITNANGYFQLNFPTLKAGNEVVVSDIYKSGYIIFNKDVVKG